MNGRTRWRPRCRPRNRCVRRVERILDLFRVTTSTPRPPIGGLGYEEVPGGDVGSFSEIVSTRRMGRREDGRRRVTSTSVSVTMYTRSPERLTGRRCGTRPATARDARRSMRGSRQGRNRRSVTGADRAPDAGGRAFGNRASTASLCLTRTRRGLVDLRGGACSRRSRSSGGGRLRSLCGAGRSGQQAKIGAGVVHADESRRKETAERIGEFWSYPESHTFAELLIDCEEDRVLRAVLVGMLREAER